MTTVAFVGAGSVEFTRQLITDLLSFEDLPSLELVLHDIDESRLRLARTITDALIGRTERAVTVRDSLDRRSALQGADFIVNTVQVGGIDATRADLEIPARYGVRQTIGDTTGVGGVFRALRTFPLLSALAADIAEVCPDAVLLNYANPMAMNIGWLHRVAPDVRAAGLCHSVVWTAHGLCDLIGVPFHGTRFRAVGVNHQAWLTQWSRDDVDLYPALRSRIAADPELRRRVRAEIFQRVGFYPTETSEHSAEYLSWFLRSDEQIARFRLEPLEYLRISEANVADYVRMRDAMEAGIDPLTVAPPLEDGAGVEYAPQVIHSLVTGLRREIHVNVVNDGWISELPRDAVVEVPATLSREGIVPLASVGPLPPVGAALNLASVGVARLVWEAASEGDPEKVRQAVLLDPNASSSATPEQIWAMCDELTRAHADLLPRSLGGSLDA